jgi:hypothetical protein
MTKIEVPDDLTTCDPKILNALALQARDLDIAVQVELARRSTVNVAAAQQARYAAIPPGRRAVVQFLEGGKWRMVWMAVGVAILMNVQTCADFARGAIERVAAEEAKLHGQTEAK